MSDCKDFCNLAADFEFKNREFEHREDDSMDTDTLADSHTQCPDATGQDKRQPAAATHLQLRQELPRGAERQADERVQPLQAAYAEEKQTADGDSHDARPEPREELTIRRRDLFARDVQ